MEDTPVDRSEGYSYDEAQDKSENRDNKDQLFHGILAGLYYLPPECILKHQSGWGWPIHYQKVTEIMPQWLPVEDKLLQNREVSDILPQFKSMVYMEVARHMDDHTCGVFRIYKLKLADNTSQQWKKNLVSIAMKDSDDKSKNIAVSNAGGYHSKPTFFADHSKGDVVEDISTVFYSVLQLVERHDHWKSKCKSTISEDKDDYNDSSGESIISTDELDRFCRPFELPTETEAWLNVSRHGAWNRLHTHEGAAWSGVYYVKVPPAKHVVPGREYGGNLLIKPSPHSTERTCNLSDTELDRLNITTNGDAWNKESQERGGVDSHTQYVSLPPDEGSIILFPSYVHHAVVPLAMKKEIRGSLEEARISLAFNFNEDIKKKAFEAAK